MTEPKPADMTARQIANQVCENWEIAAFTQEWAIARDAAIAALQQSRSAVEALKAYMWAEQIDDPAERDAELSVARERAERILSQESADA